MQNPANMALGVLGGYVLGRGKKGRLALLAIGYFAGKQMSKQSSGGSDISNLLSSPQIQGVVQQLSGPLVEAGKTAATAAATRGVSALSSNLSERTERLKGGSSEESENGDESQSSQDQTEESAQDDDAAQSSDESSAGSQDSTSPKESDSK